MRETRGRAPYPTKACPRCGSELYADMMVCYGCLYDFTRERDASAELPPPTPGLGESAGDTEDLSAAARRAASEARTGAYLRTGSVDAWVEVGEGGLLAEQGGIPECGTAVLDGLPAGACRRGERCDRRHRQPLQACGLKALGRHWRAGEQ